MRQILTVEEFAAKHNISNNKAKKMMKSKRFRADEVHIQRGAPVKGTGKPNASRK